MGDHLVLFVDRLITESTLDAAIDSRKQVELGSVDSELELAVRKSVVDGKKGEGEIVECRICQDDDEESNMETPCFCSGSLKYAHRKCVQRWCNEKRDTMCEICLQQYKPGYTAPPKLFGYGRIPLSLRDSIATCTNKHRSEIELQQSVMATEKAAQFKPGKGKANLSEESAHKNMHNLQQRTFMKKGKGPVIQHSDIRLHNSFGCLQHSDKGWGSSI